MQSFGRLVLTLPDGRAQEFELAKPSVTLGRATTNDISLANAKVSRVHARVGYGTGGCAVADLGSANGTRVNGARVERATLAPGDVIPLGNSTLRFEIAAPTAQPEVTRIESPADLHATLTQASLIMTLSDTRAAPCYLHSRSNLGNSPDQRRTDDWTTIGKRYFSGRFQGVTHTRADRIARQRVRHSRSRQHQRHLAWRATCRNTHASRWRHDSHRSSAVLDRMT